MLWGRGGSGRCQRRAVPVGHKNDPIRSVPFRVPLSVYSRRAAASFAPPTSSPGAAPLQATPLADVIAARQRPRAKYPPPAIDVIKKRRAQLCPPLTSSRRAASRNPRPSVTQSRRAELRGGLRLPDVIRRRRAESPADRPTLRMRQRRPLSLFPAPDVIATCRSQGRAVPTVPDVITVRKAPVVPPSGHPAPSP